MVQTCRMCMKTKPVQEFHEQPNSMKQKINPRRSFRRECKECGRKHKRRLNKLRKTYKEKSDEGLHRTIQQLKSQLNELTRQADLSPVQQQFHLEPKSYRRERVGFWRRLISFFWR